MEKVYYSRTNISEKVFLIMAKASKLTQQLNCLPITEFERKQESFNRLYKL